MDETQRTIFLCALTFPRLEGRRLSDVESCFVDRMYAKFPEEAEKLAAQVEQEFAERN